MVGMEACLSAHFVSRALRQLGTSPRIIPALSAKPFMKGQKNDYNDAEAIAEAALRPAGKPKCPSLSLKRSLLRVK
jgi:transposase